jgi:hypothetical protein
VKSSASRGHRDMAATVYSPAGAAASRAFEFTAFTKVSFTIVPDVALHPATGLAVVTGTITRSEAEAFTVSVKLGRTEPGGDESAVARGTGSAPVNCTATPQRWSVAVEPTVGTPITRPALRGYHLPQLISR